MGVIAQINKLKKKAKNLYLPVEWRKHFIGKSI